MHRVGDDRDLVAKHSRPYVSTELEVFDLPVQALRALGRSTDYIEFAGRPHLHMAADDWEEVAAAIDSWFDGVLDAPLTQTEDL